MPAGLPLRYSREQRDDRRASCKLVPTAIKGRVDWHHVTRCHVTWGHVTDAKASPLSSRSMVEHRAVRRILGHVIQRIPTLVTCSDEQVLGHVMYVTWPEYNGHVTTGVRVRVGHGRNRARRWLFHSHVTTLVTWSCSSARGRVTMTT